MLQDRLKDVLNAVSTLKEEKLKATETYAGAGAIGIMDFGSGPE